MKRILTMAAAALVIMLGSSWRSDLAAQPYPPDDEYYQDGDVTYQTFYDELSPHGRWVDHPQYGYVWIPDAGPDFRPYSSNGHWVYTDNYEWMWVSDYDWGWAPFHYGRWDYDPYYSWYWVPGYEWAPAWVAWRDGGDYYGWAPLRPGISISVNFSIGSYSPPYDFWCFTPRRYILYNNVFNHCIDRRQNVTIINQTTIINNYNYSRNVFVTGPRRSSVEIYTGRITPVRFRETSRPGRSVYRNNEVRIFRPNVRRDESRQFAPRNVDRYDRQTGRFERVTSRNNNDGRFDRNNTDRRNTGISPRNGNNLPQRERTERPFDRRNDQPVNRQPQNENRRNVFERNNDRQTGAPDRRMRSMEGPSSRTNDQPVMRQPQDGPRQVPGRQMSERRNEQPVMRQPQEGPRQIPGRQMSERRNDQPVMRPQQDVPRQVPGRQMSERRQEQPAMRQPQQRQESREVTGRPSREMNQPPRQMERRESGAGERGGNNGRGNGRGRGN